LNITLIFTHILLIIEFFRFMITRKLAGEYKFEYRNAPTKARKTQISTLVLEKVYSYGGRFLEQNKESNQWEDTPKKRARTKVAQILR